MTVESAHSRWMSLALQQAEQAAAAGEVPIGAVLVASDDTLLAADHNRTRTRNDPTGHAEVQVLRESSRILQNYRLLNTRLYVTIEPCVMCMGAIIHARVAQVVYGAPDPRWGALGSLYDFSQDDRFNHQPEIVSGVLEDACRAIMQAFFRARRRAAPRRPPTADTDS